MALPGIPYERRLLIMADPRDKALQDYRKKLLEHKEIDGRLKECERRSLLLSTRGWWLLGGPASAGGRRRPPRFVMGLAGPCCGGSARGREEGRAGGLAPGLSAAGRGSPRQRQGCSRGPRESPAGAPRAAGWAGGSGPAGAASSRAVLLPLSLFPRKVFCQPFIMLFQTSLARAWQQRVSSVQVSVLCRGTGAVEFEMFKLCVWFLVAFTVFSLVRGTTVGRACRP